MTSETISAQIAALRSVKLTGDEAEELGQFLALNPGQREDFDWQTCSVAARLGFNPETMDTAHRLNVAAAALMLAAEDADLTPFDRWLRKTYTPAERARLNGRDVHLLRLGFEGGGNG